jgi:hypothetical protein
MLRTLTRKRVLLVGMVAAVAVAAVAYGFFSTTGTGSGTAATASAPSTITVNQTGGAITGLYPGGSAKSLSGNFTNNGTGAVHIASVSATISSVDKAVGAPAGTCDTSNYSITGSPATVNSSIPTGTNVGSWSGLSVQMNETNVNQDACQGATVHISYTAN